MRAVYALAGALIGAAVDLAINLLAATIQARTPAEEFAQRPAWTLIAFIVVGLLAGLWLGKEILLPPTPVKASPVDIAPVKQIKIRRLLALLSYGRLRGQGIELSDILLVGSILDIDTRK